MRGVSPGAAVWVRLRRVRLPVLLLQVQSAASGGGLGQLHQAAALDLGVPGPPRRRSHSPASVAA
ncbi:hypothetical protein [Nonomuraea typhae]|uniref:Uncharacterized protein n=1 Tax=Nonomuraea typhae TaxID=2603600 RepID=A0ABW7Z8D4_9ACTN